MASPDIAAADPSRRHPACVACSKSKRKCSRQLPTCRRCRVQNLRCAYPVTVARVMLPHSPQSQSQSSVQSAATQSPPDIAPQHAWNTAGLAQDVDLIDTSWFLEPSSWDIDHVRVGEDDPVAYPDSGLDYFLDRLRTWLDQWTSQNHCAFVHPRLYESDLPSSLQHALAAWQVYRAATTPASKRIALRMAADWSQNLIQEQSIMSDSVLGVGGGGGSPDLVGQLGYTHALLVFQVIGLFDGDVKARASAEALVHTVTRWADALLQTAAVAVVSGQLSSDGTPTSAWKAWLLSESIRRLWIVATLTEAAFLIWKQGHAGCPGSIGFTGRSGLWDASSSRAWVASLRRSSTTKHPIFCRNLDRLLEEAEPSDVDDFTRALLAYARGREDLADWMASE